MKYIIVAKEFSNSPAEYNAYLNAVLPGRGSCWSYGRLGAMRFDSRKAALAMSKKVRFFDCKNFVRACK